jgi:hypothetical protein
MTGSHDPRRPVHIHPYVVAVNQQRRSRMHAHPHPDRPRQQRPLHLRRSGYRIRRALERDEKRVTGCIHLDTTVQRPRLTADPVMLAQNLHIPLRPQLGEQPRRTLDVGEQERDLQLDEQRRDVRGAEAEERVKGLSRK